MKKPILFITLGFPGSGKTYFARRFARQFGVVHLNSDKVRAELFKKPKFTVAANKIVFAEMDRRVEALLLDRKSVIYDANHIKRAFRKRYRAMAKKTGAKYVLLWFQVPLPVALKRIKSRHHPLDKWVLFHIRKATEEPTRRESRILVDGTKSYKEQAAALSKRLKFK